MRLICFGLAFGLALAHAQTPEPTPPPELEAAAAASSDTGGAAPAEAPDAPAEAPSSEDPTPAEPVEEPAEPAAPSASAAGDTGSAEASLGVLPGPDRVAIGRRGPTPGGLTGLDEVITADPGALGTLRMRFSLGYFETRGFPEEDTLDAFTSTDFAISGTPLSFVEASLAMKSHSNTNDGITPAVLQSVGDLDLGLKLGGFVTDTLALAAIAEVHLLSAVGGGGYDFGATSYTMTGALTADVLRGYGFPARFTFSVAYTAENRERLVADRPDELSVIEEFGLQVARYDRAMVAVALEAPVIEYLSLYGEYHLGTPFQVELTRRGPGSDDFTFATVPHWATAGLRVFPAPTFALDFALRFGVSDDVYTGVKATPPWLLMVGLAYTLDPRPEVIEREVVKEVAPPPPQPVERATVSGTVIDTVTKAPIAGARVAYSAVDRSPQLSGADGRFGGYRFDAGTLALQATAEGYLPTDASVEVRAGADVVVPIELSPDPAARSGSIEVRVFDDVGQPTRGRVELGARSGAKADERPPPAGEAFADRPYRAELKAGPYPLTITAEGFKADTRTVEVVGGETAQVRVTLQVDPKAPKRKARAETPRATPRARAPRDPDAGGKRVSAGGKRVTVSRRGIRLRRAITFAPGSATLTADSKKTLDELARALGKVPALTRVRIAAHTDNRGDANALIRLSNTRARSVKSYLVSRGVAAKRLQARGYGGEKPVAPNLTARGRAKNNRIQFVVLKRR